MKIKFGGFGNKKGQEEILGFLLVIIMIILIGLALLFFSRPNNAETRDDQIDNLLYSILATDFNGQAISTRIEGCEFGEGCEELGRGMTEIRNAVFTKSGLSVGQNIKGYAMNISGGVDYFVKEGQVTGVSRGAAAAVKDNLVKLTFYY